MGKIKKLKEELELLNAQLRKKNEYIERQDKWIARLNSEIDTLTQLRDGTPEDCKRGTWCKSCQFNKTHFVKKQGYQYPNTGYFCGRGDACKHYVLKEVNENA